MAEVDINEEFKKFRDSLGLIEKEELIERLTRAFNSLMMAEILVQQRMASVPTLCASIRMTLRDLKGDRGEPG